MAACPSPLVAVTIDRAKSQKIATTLASRSCYAAAYFAVTIMAIMAIMSRSYPFAGHVAIHLWIPLQVHDTLR